jgi:hypothetical protein
MFFAQKVLDFVSLIIIWCLPGRRYPAKTNKLPSVSSTERTIWPYLIVIFFFAFAVASYYSFSGIFTRSRSSILNGKLSSSLSRQSLLFYRIIDSPNSVSIPFAESSTVYTSSFLLGFYESELSIHMLNVETSDMEQQEKFVAVPIIYGWFMF